MSKEETPKTLKEDALERLNDPLMPWYLQDTSPLAGVTASSSNQYLGIQNISLFAPSPEEEARGVLCAVLVHTAIGNIRTAVRQRADMEGILLLDKVDSIALNAKVEAQVLRFVHSQCEVKKRN